MESPPLSSDLDDSAFDPAKPFSGVVVCCTSIPPEQRSEIAAQSLELGGVHKYDLTPDVTHLVVGEYDTPKYRHVAKERSDVKPMAAGWIAAVRDLWTQDAPINFRELERRWCLKPFETDGGDATSASGADNRGRLLICLTGFDDAEERQRITETITANGGAYTGDLTRKVTHLVVNKPEGRKYSAAKTWGTQTVSIEWVHDSLERGMILDETKYDPLLPKEERGQGAWNRRQVRRASLAKRGREGSTSGAGGGQDDRRRKLRRTASSRLSNQRDGLWGDILGKPTQQQPSVETHGQSDEQAQAGVQPPSAAAAPPAARPLVDADVDPSGATSSPTQDTQEVLRGGGASLFGLPAEDRPMFDACCFHIHGFSRRQTEVLVNTVLSLGGQIAPGLEAMQQGLTQTAAGAASSFSHRILIVPQESQPETRPRLPEGCEIITEFFIERCLHRKRFFEPGGHVIGRPFPKFPIEGFDRLTVCTSGFTGVDLNQVDKTIRQLGARYEERFTAQCSILVCTSLATIRRQKLDLALAWKVPVVRAEWLWDCISTGFRAPLREFMFPELNQSLTPPRTLSTSALGAPKGRQQSLQQRSRSAPTPDPDLMQGQAHKASAPSRPGIRPIDTSAFDDDQPPPTAEPPPKMRGEDSVETAAPYVTASSHQDLAEGRGTPEHAPSTTSASRNPSAPLSEVSSNSLNKSPSSPQKPDDAASNPSETKQPSTPAPAPAPALEHPPAAPPSRSTRNKLGRIPSEIADSEAADSSEEPDPVPTRNEEGPKLLLHQRTAHAAAKHVFSSKLDSLLKDTSLMAAAGAPSTSGPANDDAGGTAAAAGRPQTRRKRKILGRAVSNVSAASNASGSEIHASAAAAAAVVAGVSTAAAAGFGPAASGLLPDGDDGESRPPSTQLEYEDPNARMCKAQLMAGNSGVVRAAGSVLRWEEGVGATLRLGDLVEPQEVYGRGRRRRG